MFRLQSNSVQLSSFIFLLLYMKVSPYSKPSHVWLQNGYRDVVVSLPEDAPQKNRTAIIRSIQELFISASSALYVATKNRSSFNKVAILVPSSWGNKDLWLPENQSDPVFETNGGFPSFLDPDIAVANLINREKPYVLQDDGCGKTGLRINVPVNFLLSKKDIKNKGIEFIHYWAQYRYGVFAEGGFQNDSRYPQYYSVPGTKKIQVTACSSNQLSYNSTKISSDGSCKPQTDEQTGKPALTECRQIPIVNAMLNSSIMYQQALPNTLHFCETNQTVYRKHNPSSPSKHNTLCSGEATWPIISRSPDFAFGENPASLYDPENVTFQFMRESNIRVVIAVDVSSQMGRLERYAIVKNAIAKFVLYDLPIDVDFGLVFFAEDIKRARGMLYLTSDEAKKSFFQAAPFFEDITSMSRDACITCAIDYSLDLLRNVSNGLQNGIVILISTNGSLTRSTDADENALKLQKMKEDFKSDGIRLFTFLFGQGRSDDYEPLESLISASGGLLMHVPEESDVQTLSKLYYSFHRLISGITSSANEDYTLLLIKKVKETETDIAINFHVDAAATQNLRLMITGPHFQIARPVLLVNETKLKAPSGEEAMHEKDFFVPAWLYTFTSAEVGSYIFQTKRNEVIPKEIMIIVFGKSSTKTMKHSITLKTWLNQHSALVPGHLKVFAEIRYGKHPIINAKITANIRGPNGGDVSSFDLLDNGLGDPDITKNDGIYSRYTSIPKLSPVGYYTIIVDASGDKAGILYISDDDCCGSFVPSVRKKVIEPFNRTTGPLTFRLSRQQVGGYPSTPNRVFDLRIHKIRQKRGTVVLRWSAAGAHFDHGSALKYRLKLFEIRDDAKRHFEQIGTILDYNKEIVQFTPRKEYGKLMEYTVQWPESLKPGTYFFALKAIDDMGRSGKVSNVVEAYLDNKAEDSTPKGVPPYYGTGSAANIYAQFSISISLILRLILNRLFSA